MEDASRPGGPEATSEHVPVPHERQAKVTIRKRLYRLAALWDRHIFEIIARNRPSPKPIRARVPIELTADRAELLDAVHRSDMATLTDYRRWPQWREQLYGVLVEGGYLRVRAVARRLIFVVLVTLNANARRRHPRKPG